MFREDDADHTGSRLTLDPARHDALGIRFEMVRHPLEPAALNETVDRHEATPDPLETTVDAHRTTAFGIGHVPTRQPQRLEPSEPAGDLWSVPLIHDDQLCRPLAGDHDAAQTTLEDRSTQGRDHDARAGADRALHAGEGADAP